MFRTSLVRTYSTVVGNSVKAPQKTNRLRNFLLYTTALTTGAYVIDNQFFESTGARTVRAFYTLTRIGLDYRFKFNDHNDIQQLHEVNAERLMNLFNKNKGLYIKVGQNIANQSAIFPKPFQDKLIKLYDAVPSDPWEKVEGLLKSELGDNYSDYFQSFEQTPIASASIAQIHKAVLKNGDTVAVKVQHYYMQKQIDADLWTYKLFTKIYERFFEIPLSFSTEYIAQHIREEVDFFKEVNNAKKTEDFINNDSYLHDKIHVPKTYDISTKRILVAEWCDGESLVDYQSLKTKYDTKKIMKVYLELFSKMIFQWGFVHSDPHPGNLLVRYNKNNGKQELVLLDHGLYLKMREQVRQEYCTLWKSLFEWNDTELKKIAVSWGIGEKQSDMFASFQLMKPYHKQQKKLLELSKFEREERLMQNFKDFFKDTEKFPLELVFLGRAMRMVQLLNQRYRAPVNRINIFTKEAVRGFYLGSHDNNRNGLWWSLERSFRYTLFLVTLSVSDLIFVFTSFGNKVFGTKNIEDALQDKMISEMKKMGIENPDNIDIFSG